MQLFNATLLHKIIHFLIKKNSNMIFIYIKVKVLNESLRGTGPEYLNSIQFTLIKIPHYQTRPDFMNSYPIPLLQASS